MDDTTRDAPPPFDRPFGPSESARSRVYGAVLHAREPVTALEISERAGCDEDTARELLDAYASIGLVSRQVADRVLYSRDQEYLDERQVEALAQQNTISELREGVVDLTRRIEGYQDKYDAAEYENITPSESDDVDSVYKDLCDWATAEEERELQKRALDRLNSDNKDV